jgi:hypothetical protein
MTAHSCALREAIAETQSGHARSNGPAPAQLGDGMRTLDSPEAAVLFRNPSVLSLLEIFMVQPATLTMAATQVQLPLTSAHRMVERLVALGALEVTHLIERAGRAMKFYRATAERFFIPYAAEPELLPQDIVRKLFETHADEQVSGLLEAVRDSLGPSLATDWGTMVYPDRHGQLVVRHDFKQGRTPRLLDDGTAAYLNLYLGNLQLSPREAKQLQRELVALFKRYKTAEKGPNSYSLSIVLAPSSKRRSRR